MRLVRIALVPFCVGAIGAAIAASVIFEAEKEKPAVLTFTRHPGVVVTCMMVNDKPECVVEENSTGASL